MLQTCKEGEEARRVLHSRQMYQYHEEDQEEVCSSIEGELHQGGQSLDQLSVLLVEVLGTPRPSVLQIMGMVFRGLAVHAGNGTSIQIL